MTDANQKSSFPARLQTFLTEPFHHLWLLVFEPKRYLNQIDAKYTTWQGRLTYLYRFALPPVAIILLSSLLAAIFCRYAGIKFSNQTTVQSLAVGMLAGVTAGTFVGALSRVSYALIFGFAAGIVIGFPYAVSITIPGPLNHITVPLAAPGRSAVVGFVSAIMGGILFHSIEVVVGDFSRALAISFGIGLLYGGAMYFLVSHRLGVVGGPVIMLLCVIGFSQRSSVYRSLFIAIAFGFVFGLAAGNDPPNWFVDDYQVVKWKVIVWTCTFFAFWLSYTRVFLYGLQFLLAIYLFFYAEITKKYQDAWRKFPLVWDETILLPLPLTTDFLIKMGDESRDAAKDAVNFVLSKRPAHGDYARAALHELIYRDLTETKIEDLIRVAPRIEWFNDEYLAEQEKGLVIMVRKFSAISAHLGYYYALENAALKRRRLDEAVTELKDINQILAFATPSGSAASSRANDMQLRLTEIASLWERVIEKQSALLRNSEFVIPNPYVVGRALHPRRDTTFVGRIEIAERIKKNVLYGNLHTLLDFGPRRIGKTSLLNFLPGLMKDDNILRVVVDCQAGNAIESLTSHLAYLMREVENAIREKSQEKFPADWEAQWIASLKTSPFETFDAWIREIEKHLGSETRILICIDEYENLSRAIAAGWGESLLGTYRHLMQHHEQFILMFTGAATLSELAAAANQQDIWNSLSTIVPYRLTFLDLEDIIKLFRHPRDEFEVDYEEGTLEEIFRVTNGHPALAQAIGYELVEHLEKNKRLIATFDDAQKATENALAYTAVVTLQTFCAEAGSEGLAALRDILQGETTASHTRGSKRLQRIDILDAAGNFLVPMFEMWLRAQPDEELNRLLAFDAAD